MANKNRKSSGKGSQRTQVRTRPSKAEEIQHDHSRKQQYAGSFKTESHAGR